MEKTKLTCSIVEAAELLGISKSQMYIMSRSKDFPVVQVGKRRVVSIKGLERWVDRQAEGITHQPQQL